MMGDKGRLLAKLGVMTTRENRWMAAHLGIIVTCELRSVESPLTGRIETSRKG